MSLTNELGAEGAILAGLDLDAASRIWIVGGYKGKTARLLAEAYGSCMEVFDPQAHAIENLYALRNEAMAEINKWKPGDRPAAELASLVVMGVFEAGLLDETAGYLPMREAGNDACSFFSLPGGRDMGEGAAVDVAEVWRGPLDLMLLNCEGAEFPIIRRLYDIGALCHVRHLVAQFHLVAAEEGEYDFTLGLLARVFGAPAWGDALPSWGYWRRA